MTYAQQNDFTQKMNKLAEWDVTGNQRLSLSLQQVPSPPSCSCHTLEDACIYLRGNSYHPDLPWKPPTGIVAMEDYWRLCARPQLPTGIVRIIRINLKIAWKEGFDSWRLSRRHTPMRTKPSASQDAWLTSFSKDSANRRPSTRTSRTTELPRKKKVDLRDRRYSLTEVLTPLVVKPQPVGQHFGAQSPAHPVEDHVSCQHQLLPLRRILRLLEPESIPTTPQNSQVYWKHNPSVGLRDPLLAAHKLVFFFNSIHAANMYGNETDMHESSVDRTPTHKTHLCSTVSSQARAAQLMRLAQELLCHLCSLKQVLSSGVTHVSSTVVLSRAFLHEHFLFLHLPVLPHTENIQYIPHISKLRQSTSFAVKNHSGVKSGGNPRTTTPTGCEPKELATVSRIEAYSGEEDHRAPITEDVEEFGEKRTAGVLDSKLSETSYFQSQMHFDDSVESIANSDVEEEMLTSPLYAKKASVKPDALFWSEKETWSGVLCSETLIRRIWEDLFLKIKRITSQSRQDLTRRNKNFMLNLSISAPVNNKDKRKSKDWHFRTHNADL